MNPQKNINSLLSKWDSAIRTRPLDENRIKLATEALIEFLAEPANNTDENCSKTDMFVCLRIAELDIGALSPELQNVIGDIGQTLHDTHKNPKVATNFQSIPEQLLARVRALPRNGGAH